MTGCSGGGVTGSAELRFGLLFGWGKRNRDVLSARLEEGRKWV
jgi:hypothetical protein